MMKKLSVLVVLFASMSLVTACGGGDEEAEKKAAEEKEAARQDSLRTVVEKSEADLKAKEAELQKAYDELQQLRESSKK